MHTHMAYLVFRKNIENREKQKSVQFFLRRE